MRNGKRFLLGCMRLMRRTATAALERSFRYLQHFDTCYLRPGPRIERPPASPAAGLKLHHLGECSGCRVKLSHIFHCWDCDEVLFEGAPHGVCTRCGSSDVHPLTALLRQGPYRRWLRKIGAANGRRPKRAGQRYDRDPAAPTPTTEPP